MCHAFGTPVPSSGLFFLFVFDNFATANDEFSFFFFLLLLICKGRGAGEEYNNIDERDDRYSQRNRSSAKDEYSERRRRNTRSSLRSGGSSRTTGKEYAGESVVVKKSPRDYLSESSNARKRDSERRRSVRGSSSCSMMKRAEGDEGEYAVKRKTTTRRKHDDPLATTTRGENTTTHHDSDYSRRSRRSSLLSGRTKDVIAAASEETSAVKNSSHRARDKSLVESTTARSEKGVLHSGRTKLINMIDGSEEITSVKKSSHRARDKSLVDSTTARSEKTDDSNRRDKSRHKCDQEIANNTRNQYAEGHYEAVGSSHRHQISVDDEYAGDRVRRTHKKSTSSSRRAGPRDEEVDANARKEQQQHAEGGYEGRRGVEHYHHHHTGALVEPSFTQEPPPPHHTDHHPHHIPSSQDHLEHVSSSSSSSHGGNQDQNNNNNDDDDTTPPPTVELKNGGDADAVVVINDYDVAVDNEDDNHLVECCGSARDVPENNERGAGWLWVSHVLVSRYSLRVGCFALLKEEGWHPKNPQLFYADDDDDDKIYEEQKKEDCRERVALSVCHSVVTRLHRIVGVPPFSDERALWKNVKRDHLMFNEFMAGVDSLLKTFRASFQQFRVPSSVIVRRKQGHVWDKYDKIKELGRGSFGNAFLVSEKLSGRQYVIKALRLGENEKKNHKLVEHFKAEFDVCRKLHHLNVVRVFELYMDPYAIVMELAQGGALFDFMENASGTDLAGIHSFKISQ